MAGSHADPTVGDARDSMRLDEIREGEINVKVLRSGRKAVVLRRGDDIKVYGDLCPHMGGDMTEARYCPEAGTLTCRWHGYVFGVDDGRFRDNPNERLMSVLREPSPSFRPERTPRYRLRALAFRVEDDTLFFEGEGS